MTKKGETSEILSYVMTRTVENYDKLKEIEQWKCRDKCYFVYQILQLFPLKNDVQ